MQTGEQTSAQPWGVFYYGRWHVWDGAPRRMKGSWSISKRKFSRSIFSPVLQSKNSIHSYLYYVYCYYFVRTNETCSIFLSVLSLYIYREREISIQKYNFITTKKVCDDFRILPNLAPIKWPHRKARYPLQPLASTTGSCTRFQLKKENMLLDTKGKYYLHGEMEGCI